MLNDAWGCCGHERCYFLNTKCGQSCNITIFWVEDEYNWIIIKLGTVCAINDVYQNGITSILMAKIKIGD